MMFNLEKLFNYNLHCNGDKYIVRKCNEELVELLFEISRFLDKDCRSWQRLHDEAQDVLVTAYQVMMLCKEKGVKMGDVDEKARQVLEKIKTEDKEVKK